MAQPTPPTDGAPQPSQPWSPPSSGPYDSPAPSWVPSWPPAGQRPPVVAEPARTAVARGPLVLGLVALAGVLAGAIGGAFLVAAVFVGSAEDIGREIGAAMGSQMSDDMERAMEDVTDALLEDPYGLGSGAFGPVEEFPPVAPEGLGPDPVLNEYAQSCFDGDLQACDDLLYESAPLSPYEEYALSCGGRVKQYAVMACTDLE
jgi:hypothetical protein